MSYAKIELNLLLALESPKLDESDFILLSTKLLEKRLGNNEKFPAFFKQVKKQYLEQDYKSAIENILTFCKENEARLGTNVMQRLIATASHVKSNPKDNDSRRFYENLYAEQLESILKQGFDPSIFDDLNKAYDAVKPEYAVNELTSIHNFAEARKLLLSFLILNDNVELELKAQSPTYQKKDRSREELGQVFTVNPGIMKPNSPNFADNVVPIKIIDKIAMDDRKSDGYSKTNTQVPFVASLSGTTFSFIVVLQKYIENHKKDPDLEKKINNIVMLWISAYIKDGYHSYKEVMDIFKEQHIQSIFTQANVKLDYTLIDDTDNAFHRAQNYAQGIATKSLMHQELLQKVQEKNERYCSELLKQINQDTQSNKKYPKQITSLNNLYQNWIAGKKENQAFVEECNQICTEIKTKEQNPPFSFGNILNKIKNFFDRLITLGFHKDVFKEPPSVPLDIAIKLSVAMKQIPEISVKKATHSARKPAVQPTEVMHSPPLIKDAPKQAEVIQVEDATAKSEVSTSKS